MAGGSSPQSRRRFSLGHAPSSAWSRAPGPRPRSAERTPHDTHGTRGRARASRYERTVHEHLTALAQRYDDAAEHLAPAHPGGRGRGDR
ncbi:hypothetical protein QJS66_17520 [Kocuria rhizophila]|nr:hypothetical protein QJS66_17520 [Kocuria rhizophila]